MWLWPGKYGDEYMAAVKRTLPARDWQSLYQGDPSPEEGTYFKIEWINELHDLEIPDRERLTVYITSDYAVTADGGDWTCHMVFGVDEQDRIFVLDVWRKQVETDEGVEAFVDLMEQWRPAWCFHEKAQIEKAVGPFISKRMRERKVYAARHGFTSASDKPTKAQIVPRPDGNARHGLVSRGRFLVAGPPARDSFVPSVEKRRPS